MDQKVTPKWGEIWGSTRPIITDTGLEVLMYRKGQRVRFYSLEGEQVGPEQTNVAPAVAYAMARGWTL